MPAPNLDGVSVRNARRGRLLVRTMKALSRAKWTDFWRVNNEAFCRCALVDLCSARQFFKEARSCPQVSPPLDQAFITACAYLSHVINMDNDEKGLFQSTATKHLMGFQDSPERSAQDQLSEIRVIQGIENQKIKKVAFVSRAIIQESRLEPFFMIQEYDRITKVQQGGAGDAAPRRA